MNKEQQEKIKKNYWYLPTGFMQEKDNSPKYIVSEIQLRKVFCYQFSANILNFNKDYVKEFIKDEKLTQTNE